PSASMPTQSCGDALKNNQQTENKITDIKVTKPQPNEIISSPLEIEGEARGTWFFEASFPVKLLDSSGAEIAKGIAQAKSDWMTEDFVPFTATLQFNVPVETKGILILEKDNPSGLPENADELRVPVIIASTEMTTIRVYFNNNKLDPEISCNKVFSVERKIIKTEAIGRAALEELLKGATEEEKAQGFFSSINSGVKIQKLIIDNGTAKIDFDKQLEFQVGGSCRVSAIRAQIVETLKQFPTVKNVVISIDGRIEDILQP
ncbi:MAG: GerMN domain-containing protein, partial [Patescibacteria group bacterium]|nr:GerMN domain-containing protein [Patescibacteria group bacterium]